MVHTIHCTPPWSIPYIAHPHGPYHTLHTPCTQGLCPRLPSYAKKNQHNITNITNQSIHSSESICNYLFSKKKHCYTKHQMNCFQTNQPIRLHTQQTPYADKRNTHTNPPPLSSRDIYCTSNALHHSLEALYSTNVLHVQDIMHWKSFP